MRGRLEEAAREATLATIETYDRLLADLEAGTITGAEVELSLRQNAETVRAWAEYAELLRRTDGGRAS